MVDGLYGGLDEIKLSVHCFVEWPKKVDEVPNQDCGLHTRLPKLRRISTVDHAAQLMSLNGNPSH